MSKNVGFSKILVAIDGSEPSFKAANYGIKLAKTHGAEIVFLHVIYVSAAGLMYTTESAFKEFTEKGKKEAEKWFVEIRNKASEAGVKITTETIEDVYSASIAIVRYSEKINADIIIVGTTGKTGFKKLLLGSVASDVLRYASCPVMVIR